MKKSYEAKNCTRKYSLNEVSVPKGSKGSTDKVSEVKFSLGNVKK